MLHVILLPILLAGLVVWVLLHRVIVWRNRYLNWLLTVLRAIEIRLNLLVIIVLIWSRRLSLDLLLFSQLCLAVGEAAFFIVRTHSLHEVLAKFSFVVSFGLRVDERPLLTVIWLVIHTAHVSHSLVVRILRTRSLWSADSVAPSIVATASLVVELVIRAAIVLNHWLAIVNLGASVGWRSCSNWIRLLGEIPVRGSLWLWKPSSRWLVTSIHIVSVSSWFLSSASAISKVLTLLVRVLLLQFGLTMSKNTTVSNNTVTTVCVVSAHLSFVFRCIAVVVYANEATWLLMHRLELGHLVIHLNVATRWHAILHLSLVLLS